MKIKNVKLEWYVLHWDFNTKKVINYNILSGIKDTLVREIRAGHIYDKSILREYLKTEFMYNYWCRSEYEFLIVDTHKQDYYEKIDIWRQIEPNLDNIVEYINAKMDLNFK